MSDLSKLSLEGGETRSFVASDVREVDAKKRTVRLVVSSETVDSYGSIIVQEGMDLEKRYRANPIFLWSHPVGDCMSPGPERVLGKAVDITRDGPRTLMTFEFVPHDVNPMATMVLGLYESGALNACSVGLTDVKEVRATSPEDDLSELTDEHRSMLMAGRARYVIARSTLMEVSACYVGANLDALAQRNLAEIDRRQAARERAFCERAQRKIEEIDGLIVRLNAAAARLERAAMSPEERDLADLVSAVEGDPALRALLIPDAD